MIADGHKWLNVPYDCGFAFVRDPTLLAKVFSLAAAYLPDDEPEPTFGFLARGVPARALARRLGDAPRVGAAGYREMVERHLDLAQRLARPRGRGRRTSSGWPTSRSTSSASASGRRACPRRSSTR